MLMLQKCLTGYTRRMMLTCMAIFGLVKVERMFLCCSQVACCIRLWLSLKYYDRQAVPGAADFSPLFYSRGLFRTLQRNQHCPSEVVRDLLCSRKSEKGACSRCLCGGWYTQPCPVWHCSVCMCLYDCKWCTAHRKQRTFLNCLRNWQQKG